MAFEPRLSREEVKARLAAGGLTRREVYELEHQHPLNRLCHYVGIPTLVASGVYPIVAYLLWGVIAWQAWLLLGAVGWAFQLVGHAIEGNSPAFLRDPWQVLVGPAHFFGGAWRREPPPPAPETGRSVEGSGGA